MKRKHDTKVSLGDVARAAEVSRATACFVLRNRPGPSKETRERVLQIATQLGYTPDALMASLMTRVREARIKELVPIAWLNTHTEKDSWQKFKFCLPYLEGARARALQLGYSLEEIWIHEPGMTMRRLSQVVYQRGIEAVIVTHYSKHMRLNWDHMASVTFEGALLAPRLHRVMTDQFFNLLLALKMVRRFGYRRIGICLDQNVDESSFHACRAAAHYFQATTPAADQVEPMFYLWGRTKDDAAARQMIVAWVQRHKPEVIVGHNNQLIDFCVQAGHRVPEEIGVVHIATDDDVSDWAGVCSNRRQIGATAAERVIALLQNRQFGIPAIAESVMIRGTWHNGRTLLVPKPQS